MTILGIDPGTSTTGFGIIKKEGNNNFLIIDYGVITTPAKIPTEEKLLMITADLKTILSKHKPDLVGIEKLFFQNNQKTAMAVAESRGAILYVLASAQIKIREFTPLQVKNRLCGYGKADKKQVQFMVKKIFNLQSIPQPDDAADAIAVALCTATDQALKTL